MTITPELEKILACPHCRARLQTSAASYICNTCGKEYRKAASQAIFETIKSSESKEAGDTLFFTVKNFFKAHVPWIFRMVYEIVAIDVGPKARKLVEKLPENAVIVNVGSGVRHVHPRVINLDLNMEQGVDLVASAYQLPFQNESVDLVISESMLEHLEHPEIAVQEMHRVLKKSGRVYILTPFMVGFHSSPNDFYRWTIPGMKIFLKDFEVTETGVAVGPTCALTWMMREWLAILLSFGIRPLYQVWSLLFLILLLPLNVLDLVLSRYSFSSQIAMSYFWIARKK